MKKKEWYINSKATKKKRKFYSRPEKKRKRSKRPIAVLLVVLIASGLGFFVYKVAENMIQDDIHPSKNNQRQEENGSKELDDSVSGPYGMWTAVPDETEDTITPIPTELPWMFDFVDTRVPVKAKGIYLKTGISEKAIDSLLKMIDETELNAVVVDIKDDDGRITYKMNLESAKEINATIAAIPDIETFMKKMKEKNIYTIARVVAFKDPLLCKAKPELALLTTSGEIFKDKDGIGWLDPYNKEVWDYLVDIAEQCAVTGFDEVNFDYIRFSTDQNIKNVDFESREKTKIEIITEFVKYICEQLKPLGIFVSADVYGAIIGSSIDAKSVGQSYMEMSRYLDYICPMIYPSHYGDGYYNIDYPDTQPYKLIMGALKDSRKALNEIPEGEHRAVVRPWLQDFTASWLRHYIRYGEKEIRDQIEAVYDSGYQEWLLWNAAMNYTEEALMTEEEADQAYQNRPTPTPTPIPIEEMVVPTRSPNAGQFFESPWKSD